MERYRQRIDILEKHQIQQQSKNDKEKLELLKRKKKTDEENNIDLDERILDEDDEVILLNDGVTGTKIDDILTKTIVNDGEKDNKIENQHGEG